MADRDAHEIATILAAGPRSWLDRLAARLPDFELDRLAAAEVCIDEILSIMARRSDPCDGIYDTLQDVSAALSNALLLADGPENRLERLKRIRDLLDSALPAPPA